jgi:hypothetical protein
MHGQSLTTWAARFGQRFEQRIPRRIDEAWLTRFVDAPRFGWDMAGLQVGFIDPLYRFVDAHGTTVGGQACLRHVRPAFACKLIDALSSRDEAVDAEAVLRFDAELTALELHALSSMMLDHLDNGRNLATSQGAERQLALPVLITVAYSARQLAASMLWRESALVGKRARALAQRFSRLLFLQGIGHTLDLAGGERILEHGDEQALEDHLRWYLSPLDFEIACELAAAAADLPADAAQALIGAGADLGIAWQCARRVQFRGDSQASGQRLDQPVRWSRLAGGTSLCEGAPREAWLSIGARAKERALAGARKVGPRAEEVFEEFFTETRTDLSARIDMEVSA